MDSEVKDFQRYPYPEHFLFRSPPFHVEGQSAGGHDIFSLKLNAARKLPRALLIAGVHGNETESHAFIHDFLEEFQDSEHKLPVELYVLPNLNPDGFFAFTRQNANGVDLNRNMKTKDWQPGIPGDRYYGGSYPESENETKILTRIILNFKPQLIISLHSWKPMININGPAHPFAEAMAGKLTYPITEDVGYPTPGSLGTFAGWERQIPTITLEIERGMSLQKVYPLCRDAVLEAFFLLARLQSS
ncbi:MAG: DUF2817 domain-containing protein [Leptospiraceae bacterium]|nr:DUF2817 domain-containing protein [Leptospiraceae bacterium]